MVQGFCDDGSPKNCNSARESCTRFCTIETANPANPAHLANCVFNGLCVFNTAKQSESLSLRQNKFNSLAIIAEFLARTDFGRFSLAGVPPVGLGFRVWSLQKHGMMKCMATGNSISLSEELLAGIKNAAEAEHRSVDEVLADAVQRYLEDRSWTRLLDYGAERAKALGLEESDVDRLIAESQVEQRHR
jgi:hypothetical protein